MRIVPFVVALALTPGWALAQDDPGTMTCAQFTTLEVADQVVALSTIEPLGDEINAGDEAMAQQWAGTVTAACRDHPERLLPEAARDAMGE